MQKYTVACATARTLKIKIPSTIKEENQRNSKGEEVLVNLNNVLCVISELAGNIFPQRSAGPTAAQMDLWCVTMTS